jgi:nuclear GTP-binding protein
VWQYITLMKRIYLIDCPGVVPPSQGDSEQDILLRGVVRVENVEHPAQYIDAVLKRAQTKHIERTYELKEADYGGDSIEFLSILARKGGRLLKGGEPDVDGVAKMVLNDFLRGKIPWFTPPPKKVKNAETNGDAGEVVEGRKGQLGEIPGTKRPLAQATNGSTAEEGTAAEEVGDGNDSDFESFDDDNDHDDVDENDNQEPDPANDANDDEEEEDEDEEEGTETGAKFT